jgi:dTDP-4-dehydrorhamnose 3,5-epimerase
MLFQETGLPGAFVIDLKRMTDDRGSFARAWCAREFGARGLETRFVQGNVAFSLKAGTLRGLHLQAAPHQEVKLLRCLRGAIYDVMVDLRPNSPCFKRWFGVELRADKGTMVYVPRDFAHGYLTLEDATEVFYQVSAPYVPEAERGFRWNEPAFNIRWPREVTVISDKDRGWPEFQDWSLR